MTAFAQSERRELAHLMLEAGPDAPTLCEGWAVRDLAAHLVLRERRLDAAPGILIRPLRGYTDQVQRRLRDRPWPALVEAFRSGPPALLRLVDEQANLAEMFIHHEDVRRAQPQWDPRVLDAAEEAALWRRLSPMARLVRRKLPVGATLEAPGYGRVEVRPGEPHVTVTGGPGEFLLFLSGRKEFAQVELSGPPEAVAALKAAPLGL
ncbi:MAG: TIGR03085 family metal-binding protein [Actinomycetota bacterium]|jgi:uncharacterized protein (TIGR03085 family)|nr:TIGR03085 family metal-binding protein [Actinomycetota bacterium]